MRLIEKVEINYFRSLYKGQLDNAGDLNILFGRNDSGKSNFLRALNLFFNYETDLEREPDFDIDLSDTRKIEAQRGASRQFFSVRVHFKVPLNYRKSLGRTVWVKRQWNRSGEVTDTYPRDLTKGSKIQLTKFLSTVDYTYIPAIKDAETFSRLVRRMYDAAAESRALEIATGNFIESIRAATHGLSESLGATLGTVTQLAAPNDMGDLFKSLDFSHGDDNHSLLLQKGDGIKARHIPELLRYINENEKSVRSFIWGFEEPENSLDLGAAVAEASRFVDFSQRNDTQIFITSHSPAFYLAGSEGDASLTRRWFVSKQGLIDGTVVPPQSIRAIDTVDLAESVMGDASLHELPYVIRKLATLQADKSSLMREAQELRNQLEAINSPCLFVEGESEVTALTPSIRNLAPHAKVRKLRGTPSTTSELLKKIFVDGGSLSKNKTVFLFDFDGAGRAAFANLVGNQNYSVPAAVTDCITAFCVPPTEEFLSFLQRFHISEQNCFFPLEFLYEGDDAASLLWSLMNAQQRAESQARIREEYHTGLPQLVSHELRTAAPGTKDWLWSRGVPNNLKTEYFKQCERMNIASSVPNLVGVITQHL